MATKTRRGDSTSPTPDRWLQPVYLPAEAFTDFSRRLNEALQELEDRHAVPARDGESPADRQAWR